MNSKLFSKNQGEEQELFSKIIGLGEKSPVKSYYPELRKKLKELEKFRLFMDGIKDFIAVFEFGIDGSLIDSNQSFRTMMDIDDSGADKLSFSEVISLSENSSFNWDSINQEEGNANLYMGDLHTEKEKIPVEFSLTTMETDGKKYIVFIGRDITERLERENTLKKLNKMLEEKLEKVIQEKFASQEMMIKQSRQAAMGEMIGNIAHQWRQPLCALGLFVQDLLECYDAKQLNREYIEKFTEESMEQILFMSNTIDNFRNYYTPDKEKTEMDIIRLIKETVAIVNKQFQMRNVEIKLNTEHDNFKPLSQGRENEFKQVMLNLLNNAFYAIQSLIEKSVIESGLVEINVTESPNHIYIDVSDNGGGIPENILNKVFEPYFTTKEEGEGTGVGLYMSKKIIEENMGGYLSAQSENGHAIFTVKLKKVKQ